MIEDDDVKNKGGRPPHEYSDFIAGKVHCALSYGMSQEEIESYVGHDIDTLKKHYAELFATVKADRHGAVKKALFYQAVSLNIPASTIFYLKTQCEEFQEKKDESEDVDKHKLLSDIASAIRDNKPSE